MKVGFLFDFDYYYFLEKNIPLIAGGVTVPGQRKRITKVKKKQTNKGNEEREREISDER